MKRRLYIFLLLILFSLPVFGQWDKGNGGDAGTGDIESVGDCTSGACGDGSSDGGTYHRWYDSTSAYIAATAGVRTWTIAPSNANAENLVMTFGNNDNTMALSSSTGATVSITGNAATATKISDLAADILTALTGYKYTFSSTLNTAGANFTFTNTTADLTADVSFIDWIYTDDGDANAFVWRAYDNVGDLKSYLKGDGALTVQSITVPGGFSIAATSAGGQYSMYYEDTDNGSGYSGDGVYGNITGNNVIYIKPLTDGLADQIIKYAAPAQQTMSDGSTQYVAVGTWTYKDAAQMPMIGDADDFDNNCTGACLYGGEYIVNAAGTAVLPEPAEGMNFSISLEGANATPIDPLGTGTADTIYLNGLAAAADENITSSTSGAECVFRYRSANTWKASCNGFAEATPP